MRKILLAAVIAATFALGIAGVVSAHSSEPANMCQGAFTRWEYNRDAANEASLVACLQTHTVGGTSPFNGNNFGYNTGVGFNPNYGFNPGFGFVPFDGFGPAVTACPGGTFAALGGTVSHPSWQCVPGLGNRFPGACPSGEQLVELGTALNPIWDCVV